MRNKYRNIFLAFSITTVPTMIFTLDMDYQEFWADLRRVGVYLPLVLLLWPFVYLISITSWYIITRNGRKLEFSFVRPYKFTVMGFALDYVAPAGLMGDKPYRIMELRLYIGVEKTTSSVILYVMIHILSHFCFWLSSALLCLCLYPVGWVTGTILGVVTVFCLLVAVLFVKGYQHGMAVALARLDSHLPFPKEEIIRLADSHREQLGNIDKQIALLYQQKKGAFYAALFLGYMAHVVNCLEIWPILNILIRSASSADCCLVAAFSSLLASPLFFLSMQLGGREGEFVFAVGGLPLSGAYGAYVVLVTRMREVVWIAIGLASMKVGSKK